jgi:hypothetical protein
MKRHAVTAFAALSLVVCLAAAVLWVRGFWWIDQLEWRGVRGNSVRDVEARSAFGRLVYMTRRVDVLDPAVSPIAPGDGPRWSSERLPPGARAVFDREVDRACDHQALGAGFARRTTATANWSQTATIVVVPHPYVVALAATAPMFWVRGWVVRRRARSRAARGLCPQCGYDVRASTGACPECGGESAKADEGQQ